jgi:hypothetical protein
MAKSRRRYRILYPRNSILSYLYVAGLNTSARLQELDCVLLQVPGGLSDRIEIIDDSQSAVVDSLLELVSRRCKRVVSCSFLITAGRKRSTLFRCGGNEERSDGQRETIKTSNFQDNNRPKPCRRSRLRRTSSVQSGSTGCVHG